MTKPKQTTEITIITSEFTEVITKSGIDYSEAEKLALGYQPLMAEVIEQANLLKPLDKTNADHAKIAKRVSLDLGKICSRLTTKKGEDKATLLVKTRLIDGLFNVAESTARLAQKDADDIVEYLDNIEKERLSKIANERRVELEKYDAITTYLPLDIMGDDQYQRCLEDAKLAFNARKQEAERLESERLQKIKDDELAEKERQRLEIERLEAERLEAERIKKKKDEEARIESEKKAALLAPDKEKINQLYLAIKGIVIPDFKSTQAKIIGTNTLNKLGQLLSEIKEQSKQLK